MSKDEIKLVPYNHTLYDSLINENKGKYFQSILAPHLIAQIPKENNLNLYYIENEKLSVWFPLLEKWGEISLEEFNQYAIISEEQFKDYQNNKYDLSKIVLAHKDAPIFKKKNKANLSELEGSSAGVKVDKSKATDYTPMRETPFSRDLNKANLSELEVKKILNFRYRKRTKISRRS